jgi:hypothetical protein
VASSSYQEPSYGQLLTTTKYCWDTFVPYTIPRQQEQRVPEQYLKNARWGYSPHTGTEGYHATSSAEDDGTLYPVEFIYDHVCWAEIKWNQAEGVWDVYRLAGSDLGLDIQIAETRAGEYRNTEENSPPHPHTPRTPAPSDAGDSEPETINVLPSNPEEEERLAQLAESIPLPSQDNMTTQTTTEGTGIVHAFLNTQSGGNLTGSGGSQPLRGRQPGGPSGGGGPPSGGGPSGGGGPPSGGGHPLPGQQPSSIPPPSSGRFIGKEPQTFTGDRTKADEFFTQWNLFVSVNYSNSAMTNAFSRSMLFLTYMQGPHVNEWVLQQHRWLVNEVTHGGVHPNDQTLWNTIERAFKRNFADTLEQENAQATLKKGIKMIGEDLDSYIAKFELLARQARYHVDNVQTLDIFTQGLPNALYADTYKLDDPQDYDKWKRRLLQRQRQFIHVKTRLNNFRTTQTPRAPQNNWGPRSNYQAPRANRDPNAMDTSLDRIRARGGTVATDNTPQGKPPFPPRGGGQGNGFDIRTVTCYRCNKQGHISRDCPQQSWNRNPRGNFQSRGGSRGGSWRGTTRNNARTAQVEEESNAEYFNAEQGVEEHQIARAVAGTDEERSKQWLEGVASENDAVKDMIIQSLWKEEDFRGA